ncbi:MAG: hypothetical protein HKO56_02915, partial [Bacteroidia bacterium]|nr:hypothetical protein [Bacteroidia bacterium]
VDLSVSPSDTQQYYFTYTDGVSGCEDVGTLTVNVLANPIVTASSNSPVCEEDQINLFETGGEATAWSWTGPNSFTSSMQNPSIIAANVIHAGDYTITVTDANACTSSQTTTVVVGVRPDAGFNTDNAVCISAPSAASISLTAMLSGAETGGAWSETTSSGVDISDPNSVDFSATEPGVYTFEYTLTGTDGCPDDIAVITITANDTECGAFPWTGSD